MRYMSADQHCKVASVSGWCVWHDLRESGRFCASARQAFEQRYDGAASEFIHEVFDLFLEQADRAAVEMWKCGSWQAFCAVLSMYNEKGFGEGGMHDTAMLLSALGWDGYDAGVEIVRPYFGSSGTVQINAAFPVTPAGGG